MKTVKNIVFRGAFYAILIASLFCFYTFAEGLYQASFPIGQFFLIVLFGILISAAQQIFLCENLSVTWRYVIHYISLLISFFVLSLATGKIALHIFNILIAFVAFTVIYLLLLFGMRVIRKNFHAEKAHRREVRQKETYQSRFKS